MATMNEIAKALQLFPPLEWENLHPNRGSSTKTQIQMLTWLARGQDATYLAPENEIWICKVRAVDLGSQGYTLGKLDCHTGTRFTRPFGAFAKEGASKVFIDHKCLKVSAPNYPFDEIYFLEREPSGTTRVGTYQAYDIEMAFVLNFDAEGFRSFVDTYPHRAQTPHFAVDYDALIRSMQ